MKHRCRVNNLPARSAAARRGSPEEEAQERTTLMSLVPRMHRGPMLGFLVAGYSYRSGQDSAEELDYFPKRPGALQDALCVYGPQRCRRLQGLLAGINEGLEGQASVGALSCIHGVHCGDQDSRQSSTRRDRKIIGIPTSTVVTRSLRKARSYRDDRVQCPRARRDRCKFSGIHFCCMYLRVCILPPPLQEGQRASPHPLSGRRRNTKPMVRHVP
jgi:hypothetical protein